MEQNLLIDSDLSVSIGDDDTNDNDEFWTVDGDREEDDDWWDPSKPYNHIPGMIIWKRI